MVLYIVAREAYPIHRAVRASAPPRTPFRPRVNARGKFDGWRAQLHKTGRDMDTPVNMVGALFKCCLSQFWKMIVAKRAMLLPWSALIFAVERSGRRRGINRAGAGQSSHRASRLR